MGDYGIKVSATGYDVSSAGDINILLKGSFTLLKVVASGTTSLTTEWTTISHNLSYVPQFLIYVNDKTNSKTYLGTGSYSYGLGRSDTSNIYIKRINASGDTAYYYIFYEAA